MAAAEVPSDPIFAALPMEAEANDTAGASGDRAMAERPTHPTDGAIWRLLAAGALSSGAIAKQLAMPERTVRHRLTRLRASGHVLTDPDGRHRLAAPNETALAVPDQPDLAARSTLAATGLPPGPKPLDSAQPDLAAGSTLASTGLPAGWAVLAVTGTCLAGVLVIWWLRVRTEPSSPPARWPDPWQSVRW